MGSHLLRQGGEGVVVLIGEELQLEQDGAGGHWQDDHLDMEFEAIYGEMLSNADLWLSIISSKS